MKHLSFAFQGVDASWREDALTFAGGQELPGLVADEPRVWRCQFTVNGAFPVWHWFGIEYLLVFLQRAAGSVASRSRLGGSIQVPSRA